MGSRGREAVVKCPIPGCGSRSRKLSINMESHKNHCWVCGWRAHTLAPLLVKMGARSSLDAYKRFGKSFSSMREGEDAHSPATQTFTMIPQDCVPVNDAVGHAADWCASYIRKRGIDPSIAEYYRLRVGLETCPQADLRYRIIVPSWDSNGSPNYWVARTTINAKPKYIAAEKQSSEIVFREFYVDWDEDLVLVEGAFDSMGLKRKNSLAFLGSNPDESYSSFCSIVSNCKSVTVFFDRDAVKKSYKLAAKLNSYGVRVRCVDWDKIPSVYDDPGGMISDQAAIDDALACADVFDRDFMLSLKLRGITDSAGRKSF